MQCNTKHHTVYCLNQITLGERLPTHLLHTGWSVLKKSKQTHTWRVKLYGILPQKLTNIEFVKKVFMKILIIVKMNHTEQDPNLQRKILAKVTTVINVIAGLQ